MINYKILFSLLFSVVVNSLFSQTNFKKYHFYRHQALMANLVKDYKSEKMYYEKAFKFSNAFLPAQIDLTDYSYCLLNNKDTLKALKYMEKAIAKGNNFPESSFIICFGKNYGNQIIKKMPELKKEFYKWLAQYGSIELLELDAADQTVRNLFLNRNTTGITEQIGNKMIVFIDSINFLKLNLLMKKEDVFPSTILLYHIYGNNGRYFQYIDSVLRVGIYEGKIYPESYVQWYDRQRIYVNKLTTQLYGEWNESGSKEFTPIEDIANVDKRREELGLCSLKDYALLNGMNLPKDYISH
jgi:hypothetical protein